MGILQNKILKQILGRHCRPVCFLSPHPPPHPPQAVPLPLRGEGRLVPTFFDKANVFKMALISKQKPQTNPLFVKNRFIGLPLAGEGGPSKMGDEAKNKNGRAAFEEQRRGRRRLCKRWHTVAQMARLDTHFCVKMRLHGEKPAITKKGERKRMAKKQSLEEAANAGQLKKRIGQYLKSCRAEEKKNCRFLCFSLT